jgi:hypothetical protein
MAERIERLERTRAWWGYSHPALGTCTPGCRSYGRCHCGCGEFPSRATTTFQRRWRVKGEPYVFRAGHHSRVILRSGGHWSRRGIPVERVRPLLVWLHHRHGTWQAVADLLRMPVGTVKGYANNARRRRVPPTAARRIQQLILAHRTRGSVLDQWETEPGPR